MRSRADAVKHMKRRRKRKREKAAKGAAAGAAEGAAPQDDGDEATAASDELEPLQVRRRGRCADRRDCASTRGSH